MPMVLYARDFSYTMYMYIQYASKKSCQYRLPFDRSVQTAKRNGDFRKRNGYRSHRLSVPFTVGRCRSGARASWRAYTLTLGCARAVSVAQLCPNQAATCRTIWQHALPRKVRSHGWAVPRTAPHKCRPLKSSRYTSQALGP